LIHGIFLESSSIHAFEIPLISNKRYQSGILHPGYRDTERGKAQRFFCNYCKRKFILDQGFEKMKATPETITVALDLYFKGISMRAIVDHIKQFYGIEVSHVAIYKWIRKYIEMMKRYCDQLVPKVSGIWHTDEMTLNIRNLENHENLTWAWNVIDNQSRYRLATQITEKRLMHKRFWLRHLVFLKQDL
jgi:hypothetical protein